MRVPSHVIERLDSVLGISGQPHLILDYVLFEPRWIDKGCFYWSVPEPLDWSALDHDQEIDRTLKRVRHLLTHEPVIAYKGNLSFLDITMTLADRIVVAPTTDQFDILRIELTNGADYGLETEDIIAELQQLDSKYGIDLLGASDRAIEFLLKRMPEGEEIHELAERLLQFCPDIGEAPEGFPGGRVALWWD